MFKTERAQRYDASPDEMRRAVESAKDLYLACLDLAAGRPGLDLALISLAIQYQTGEFRDDVAEFERRVIDLLAEAAERQDNNPLD